ncbi:hypothetical protein [Vibrio algarum]|uniref:Uncharacterized protein n=1 Tax=Vibrio algarum TaxID=3020714 RepID=A0ABT4YT30_9VIBR|nr:hypothetical protein [Vibrio sp. KJ40-1]MDB1124718.1 hypothetical protein [Vibrio sp. KJ40-1]
MLKDVIDRVNQARKKAQQNSHFQQSAQQHAKAIESQETPTPIIKKENTNQKSSHWLMSINLILKLTRNIEPPHLSVHGLAIANPFFIPITMKLKIIKRT